MARWEFKLPDIGEGVTEGEIVGWLIKAGDVVTEDQPMVEVMTDKATVTIAAPKAGAVVETRGKVELEVVPVARRPRRSSEFLGGGAGSRCRRRPVATQAKGTNGHGAGNGQPAGSGVKDDGPAATAVGDIKESLPGMASLSSAGRASSAAAGGSLQGYFNEKPLATPATRKLARDMNVDLRHVPPSGPQGRVTRKDVESFTAPVNVPVPLPVPGRAGHAPVLAPVSIPHAQLEERIPFAGVRRKIAQKMAQSKHTAAHFTFVEECDVTALKALRARLKGPAEAAGVKLSFLPFIVKAVVAALKKHPWLNTARDEATSEIVFRKYFHIGIAAATEAGLMVPVVKDADRRSVLDVAREIERLSNDARTGKVKLGRPAGLHLHHHLARQPGRPLRDAHHQLPGGRHPRRPPDEAAPGRQGRTDRHRRRDAPLALLRSPHRRRARGRRLRVRRHRLPGEP